MRGVAGWQCSAWRGWVAGCRIRPPATIPSRAAARQRGKERAARTTPARRQSTGWSGPRTARGARGGQQRAHVCLWKVSRPSTQHVFPVGAHGGSGGWPAAASTSGGGGGSGGDLGPRLRPLSPRLGCPAGPRKLGRRPGGCPAGVRGEQAGRRARGQLGGWREGARAAAALSAAAAATTLAACSDRPGQGCSGCSTSLHHTARLAQGAGVRGDQRRRQQAGEQEAARRHAEGDGRPDSSRALGELRGRPERASATPFHRCSRPPPSRTARMRQLSRRLSRPWLPWQA